MKYFFVFISIVIIGTFSLIIFKSGQKIPKNEKKHKVNIINENDKMKLNKKNKEFTDSFSNDYILEETGTMEKSKNKFWWVNSGAFMYVENGVARTLIGKLDKDSKWQKKFANSNEERVSETDGGYRPQNIFRLVTRTKWKNFNQEVYFKIEKYNLSNDKHRSESNGFLLFNRYQDGNNLYYVGLRVDGYAIIKKKINGKYITLKKVKVLEGEYDRIKNPNLIPLNKWIGIKSEVKYDKEGRVIITFLIDLDKTGEWNQVMQVTDDGSSFGGGAILDKGYAGIRTDFMDVKFDNYKIVEISH